MMSYVCTLRKSEKAYEQEMKDNPCFHRHHFDSNNVETTIEFAKHADIVRGHSKWEGRIYKVLRQNLESSEDWSDKRNTLLLLSESCDSYPVLERYARGVLQCVENVRDREKANDLKTLANSLAVKLKACSKNWIKVEAKESAKSTPKIAPKPKEAPKDLSKEALKETSKDAKEVSKEVPKEVPKDASKDVSKDAPKDPSKERKEIKEPPKASAKAKEDAKAKPKEGQKKEAFIAKHKKEPTEQSGRVKPVDADIFKSKTGKGQVGTMGSTGQADSSKEKGQPTASPGATATMAMSMKSMNLTVGEKKEETGARPLGGSPVRTMVRLDFSGVQDINAAVVPLSTGSSPPRLQPAESILKAEEMNEKTEGGCQCINLPADAEITKP
eukprot:g8601.t1